jgi:hypothetical protein
MVLGLVDVAFMALLANAEDELLLTVSEKHVPLPVTTIPTDPKDKLPLDPSVTEVNVAVPDPKLDALVSLDVYEPLHVRAPDMANDPLPLATIEPVIVTPLVITVCVVEPGKIN